MIEFERCRAVVFDAYGTLFDVGAPTRQLLGHHAEKVGELWRRKQLEYTWLRSLMGRHADFGQVTAEALDFALAAIPVGDEKLASQLLEAYRSLPAYPDAAAALAAVRAGGRRTAILSNGSPEMLSAAVSAAGLGSALDLVLSVEEAGVFKPHPDVYALACRHLDLLPQEICFVSANGWDAAGAAVFGFAVAWLNRRGEPEDRLPGSPAAQIKSLAGLPTLLGLTS